MRRGEKGGCGWVDPIKTHNHKSCIQKMTEKGHGAVILCDTKKIG